MKVEELTVPSSNHVIINGLNALRTYNIHIHLSWKKDQPLILRLKVSDQSFSELHESLLSDDS